MRQIFFRLLSLFRSGRAEQELSREIESHLQLLEDQYVARGMGREAARYAARRQKARAHAVPPSAVRVASLAPRGASMPGGTLVALGPFAILLTTAPGYTLNFGNTRAWLLIAGMMLVPMMAALFWS
jgi:hypothetical protein